MDSPRSSKAQKLPSSDVTRRELLEVAAVTGGILVAGGHLMPAAVPPAAAQTLVPSPAPLEVVLRVNGADQRLTLDPRTTLLDGLAPAYQGCEEGLWPWPMRRLHRPHGRQAREVVPF